MNQSSALRTTNAAPVKQHAAPKKPALHQEIVSEINPLLAVKGFEIVKVEFPASEYCNKTLLTWKHYLTPLVKLIATYSKRLHKEHDVEISGEGENAVVVQLQGHSYNFTLGRFVVTAAFAPAKHQGELVKVTILAISKEIPHDHKSLVALGPCL